MRGILEKNITRIPKKKPKKKIKKEVTWISQGTRGRYWLIIQDTEKITYVKNKKENLKVIKFR